MSSFLITWILTIIFAIISIICLIIAFFIEEGKYSVMASLASAILALILLFNIEVSKPIIEPLDYDIKNYETDIDITISSEEPKYFKIFYSLDGADPKFGNIYSDKIIISKSTTVCARCKFLWKWSEISKNTYKFTETPTIKNSDENNIDVDEEVKYIQKKYKNLPEPNSLPEPTSDNPINKCYDDNNMKIIKVFCGYDNINYSRMYYYENDKIYFAFIYFKGEEEHRLYFKDDSIIRYKDENGIIYDADEGDIVCEWTKFALEDSYEVLNKTEK